MSLERAVKLSPREPLARQQLAKVLERASDWTGAVEQYRVLTELKPDEAEYAYALGSAYLHLSEWSLKQLAALESGAARIHLDEKRWAEARQEIERELAIVPESAGARALLARLQALEAGAP